MLPAATIALFGSIALWTCQVPLCSSSRAQQPEKGGGLSVGSSGHKREQRPTQPITSAQWGSRYLVGPLGRVCIATCTPQHQSLLCCCVGATLQDPFAEKTVYNDGPVDRMFIKLFTQKMADQLDGERASSNRLLHLQQQLRVGTRQRGDQTTG